MFATCFRSSGSSVEAHMESLGSTVDTVLSMDYLPAKAHDKPRTLQTNDATFTGSSAIVEHVLSRSIAWANYYNDGWLIVPTKLRSGACYETMLETLSLISLNSSTVLIASMQSYGLSILVFNRLGTMGSNFCIFKLIANKFYSC
ncbi:hypothetical protein V6N11_031388 [Hibiscus sabdariffa]|uniref:Uncharacterized protein n=1 Tax=Hibiscus sabdariffa TaxID=183260 RepID=A0ABR2SYA9_9ROSI